jgi:hypothetical protein
MNKRLWKVSVAAFVVILPFVLLVPVIQFNTNVSPACARQTPPHPCLLVIGVPLHSPVYWSISAYFLGIGAYYVEGIGYGLT